MNNDPKSVIQRDLCWKCCELLTTDHHVLRTLHLGAISLHCV